MNCVGPLEAQYLFMFERGKFSSMAWSHVPLVTFFSLAQPAGA